MREALIPALEQKGPEAVRKIEIVIEEVKRREGF